MRSVTSQINEYDDDDSDLSIALGVHSHGQGGHLLPLWRGTLARKKAGKLRGSRHRLLPRLWQ